MAEQRLIDANAAVELLRSLGSRDYRREKGTIADAIKMLSHPAYTPTVNAVEVVRCRDCAHRGRSGRCWGPQEIQAEEGYDFYFADDDFRSYGERRTDGYES